MKNLILSILSIVLITSCSVNSSYNNAQTNAIERASPKYPIQAARDRVEGYVYLSFDINDKGRTQNIEVIKGVPEGIFDKEAIKAVSKWVYEPAIKNGKAVAQKRIAVTLDFILG